MLDNIINLVYCFNKKGNKMSLPRTEYNISIEDMKKRVEYDKDTGEFFLLSKGFPSLNIGNKYIKYKAGERMRKISVVDKAGYGKICIKETGVQYIKSHRYAWAYVYGYFPKVDIDHINGIKNDNRICNLRLAPFGENNRNVKKPTTNTSGTIGVSYLSKSNSWRAYIWKEGKQVSLGQYKEKEDAISARKKAEVEYKYHKNHGR